jgi:uncharacterized membrane protein SpoIIM required for sporulation
LDLDRFVVQNGPMWNRLDQLSSRARAARSSHKLAPAESEELVTLYQLASAQLSHARTYYDDTGLTARLTTTVAAGRAAIYGTPNPERGGVRRFFSETFPAAVWISRRFILISALLTFLPAIAAGVWMGHSQRALDATIPKDQQQAVVASEFEDYYSSEPAADFSTHVLVNNIEVSIYVFAGGIALCIPTALLLAYNGLNVGVLAGLFAQVHQQGKFYGLILPHGILELTAVTIAGAAGLRLGWSIIAPGDRPRGEALAEEGRRSIVLILGLMLAFVVAGTIEGFVTPSGLPTFVRVGIGVLVEACFVAWVVGQGRPAVARGVTGQFGERRRAELEAVTGGPLP